MVGGSATPAGAQREAGGGTGCGTGHEAFAVVFDLGLSERVEIGDDLSQEPGRPSAAIRYPDWPEQRARGALASSPRHRQTSGTSFPAAQP